MNKYWIILAGVMLVLACLGVSLYLIERTSHAATKAECEKREALIKQAGESADAIAKSLEAERRVREALEADYIALEKKYNSVRRGGKRAKDYAKQPIGAYADSLRASSLRAVRE